MKKYENLIYGVGAGIVILGALFKIQHWAYGSLLLTIGMLVEAGIFIYSGIVGTSSVDVEVQGGQNFGVHTKAVEEYNAQVEIAVNNIEDLNKMYEKQLKGFSETTGMSDRLREVNAHLESLSNVYRAILRTMKS